MIHETLSLKSFVSTLAVGALLVWAATPSLAQGRSNHGGGSAAQSGGHMSAQGVSNSNDRYSADRDFGRDRASDRMSDQGLARNQAEINEIRTAARNRDATRMARLRADDRADRDDRENHGAKKAGFCPPGQAKKAGSGSHFNC